MSTLIIAHDSHLMMLEMVIEKLCIPSSNPFDSVVMSKSIASFRFLDDEWVDVMPNRLDYKKYRGSCGENLSFHGGKSLVYAIPSSCLACPVNEVDLEISVRREISPYFETDSHVTPIGEILVNVAELHNAIVEELRLRRELGNFLKLPHERDPISKSLKGTFVLQSPDSGEPTNSQLDLYLRLSYLGNSVVTEIDRPSRVADTYFYAQEETNLATPYECREIEPEMPPSSKAPLFSSLKGCDLECVCTDDQRYGLLLDICQSNICAQTDNKDKGKGKKDKKKKKQDKGTLTDAETADKGIGTDKKDKFDPNKLNWADLMKLLKKQHRGGGAMVGIEDKKRPCPPPCIPCIPCDPCDPCYPANIGMPICEPVCMPATDSCPPPVYCYD